MYPIKTIILVILSLLMCSCSINEPVKYAIVYGVSEYPYPGLELPYSANDAVSVSRLLEHLGYEVILRTDDEASMQNIEKDFATLSRMIDDNDLFLFYFSGHGLSKQTMLELNDSIVGDDYFSMLLYHEFAYSNLSQYINANTLSNQKLNQLFNTLPDGLKMGVIDACYSGHLINNQGIVDYTPDDYDGSVIRDNDFSTIVGDAIGNYNSLKNKGSNTGYMLLTSSGSNEVSWDGFFSHSVFTYFFLMSAEQGDLNKDGVITALESYCYAYAACQKYWNTPTQDAVWNFLPKITGGAEDLIIFGHPTIITATILNSQ
ncbi:hypothetical protein AGMMS49982_12750 [Bacteroidia bacterium]|nr:hypothetical protein AGMMS49982_12750 [Bacteroidia bacterium]